MASNVGKLQQAPPGVTPMRADPNRGSSIRRNYVGPSDFEVRERERYNNEMAAWRASQSGGSSTPATSNLGSTSADLMKNQEAFIAASSADIDRDTQRGFQQGMSNMIASGLSGTTAVGGMQTGLTEAAVRAKAGVAADAQSRTDQLQLGYTGLAQQASEGAANRQTQMSLGQLGADTAITQAALNQPRVQQADTGRFESVIQSLQDEIKQLRDSMGKISNQGGTSVERLY